MKQRKIFFKSGTVFCVAVLTSTLSLFVSAESVEGYCYEAYQLEEYKKAIHECLDLAEKGDLKAQYNVGKMFDKGWGVEQSDSSAYKWYLSAARGGHAKAQNNAGVAYHKGVGVEQSKEKARYWFKKAAHQGSKIAQKNYAWYLQEGFGGEQSYSEAAKWYRKSAEQGYAESQYRLGLAYRKGRGVDESDEKARYWFKKSAENHDDFGQYYYALYLEKGLGGYQSYSEALKWYKKSSAQGDEDAFYRLGLMYEKGNGTKKDKRTALKMFKNALAKGNEKARSKIKTLQAQIKVDEFEFDDQSCTRPAYSDYSEHSYDRYADCIDNLVRNDFRKWRSLMVDIGGKAEATHDGWTWTTPGYCDCERKVAKIAERMKDRHKINWEKFNKAYTSAVSRSKTHTQQYQQPSWQGVLDQLEGMRQSNQYYDSYNTEPGSVLNGQR